MFAQFITEIFFSKLTFFFFIITWSLYVLATIILGCKFGQRRKPEGQGGN